MLRTIILFALACWLVLIGLGWLVAWTIQCAGGM